MKRIYIRRKSYAVDDEVMDEFKTLRSRQSKLWRRIRTLEEALGNAIPFIDDGELCGKVKSMLEEENKYLKGLLARLIGVALSVKDANASLAVALESMHRASIASAEAIKSIPFEGLKEAPDSLKDFINECLTDKGERHDAN